MTRMIQRLRTAVFAAGVGGTLAFGATAALAQARPCPLTSIGSCGNLAKCQDACLSRGGDPSGAACTNGCCFCPGLV